MSRPAPSEIRRTRGGGLDRADELGYHAASEARRSPAMRAQGGPGDYHLRLDRDILIKTSRAFARDNALFQGLHRVSIDNILGAGFGLQAKTANKSLNVRLEKLWKETFSEAPEIRGLDKWHAIEKLALSDTMIAGDVGAIKLSSRDRAIDGRLQMIEAEQIDAGRTEAPAEGSITGGVALDRYGRILRYYVKNWDPKRSSTTGRARGIAAADFVFMAHRRRISQTRGVPALVASFPDISRLDDILSSEAASWQLISRLAYKREQVGARDAAWNESKEDDNKSPSTHELAQRVHDIGMALVVNCEPGETVESIKHDIPAPNLQESVRVFLRMLGLPLGLPLELILLDWSQTNYSSARAALEQAFLNFLRWQLLLEESWHDPIYEWQVRRWVKKGLVTDRDDIARHEWIRPQFPWLDQLKEAQAWGLKLDRGLTTHGEALKSVNRDRDDWLETREREVAEAMVIADRLNEQRAKPDPELWKHFCGLGLKKTNVSRTGASTPTAEGGEKPEGQETEGDDE